MTSGAWTSRWAGHEWVSCSTCVDRGALSPVRSSYTDSEAKVGTEMGQPRRAARWPRDKQELGIELARLRAKSSLTLRAVEEQTSIRKSTLSNYENGRNLTPKATAERLDVLYQTGEWIQEAVTQLQRWNPWANDQPAGVFAKRWHATYGGTVTIRLVPQKQHVSADHRLTLQWGPHALTHTVASIPADGVLLFTNKSEEDESVACHLTVTPASFVQFGYADPATSRLRTIDLNDLWK